MLEASSRLSFRMQESTFTRRKGILGPSSMLVLLILPLGDLPSASGSCEFPSNWAGEWYQYGKLVSVIVNATVLGERSCVERSKHSYVVYGDNCYHCMIINDRHENVIQYREGWCYTERSSLDDMCSNIKSDDTLFSMFRINSTPITCPFSGPSFTFTYDKGSGECAMPISLAEKCTDESKLLLKYQACPDVDGTESNTEELQCLAVWNDGRNKYLVGTLKGRNALGGGGKTYRCFLYEEKAAHHQGRMVYLLAQSGDPTCNGLTTVSEGSPTIKLTRVDKEHNRCKYPSWITEHHDWYSLDGTKVYHFTNKNATLKVRAREMDGDAFREEKVVCHNLDKSNDDAQSYQVKLVAHVTSGCDIGYVCMIFHKRDRHVVELQQSNQKAIMPDEACTLWDPSSMPYTTLISSSLRRRRCPNAGRYTILGFAPFRLPATPVRRQRRSDKRSSRTAKGRTWRQRDREEETNDGEEAAEEEEEIEMLEEEVDDNDDDNDDEQEAREEQVATHRQHHQHQRREEDRNEKNHLDRQRDEDGLGEIELSVPQEEDEEAGMEKGEEIEEDRQEEKQRQQRREEECGSTDVHIGCSLTDPSEMIVGKTCDRRETAYYCHGSWEERGTWYTIVSQKSARVPAGLGRTFCFSMRFSSSGGPAGNEGHAVLTAERTSTGVSGRPRATPLGRELWLSRPERACRREATREQRGSLREPSPNEWAYRLIARGACEDATKVASSNLAALSSSPGVPFALIVGSCAMQLLLSR